MAVRVIPWHRRKGPLGGVGHARQRRAPALSRQGPRGGRHPGDPPRGPPHPRVLARLDGLMLVGGGDLDPLRYGAVPHPRNGHVNPVRDEAEAALLEEALEQRLPILGICRGLQLLNVVLGGTLHQHVPDVVGHKGRSGQRRDLHPARRAPASALRAGPRAEPYDAGGAEPPPPGDRPARRWPDRVRVRSDDGLIEAIELEGHTRSRSASSGARRPTRA